jgi:formylglycine-generating enzyme required for sulfatase activity
MSRGLIARRKPGAHPGHTICAPRNVSAGDGPVLRITISPFEIDTFTVTNANFGAFIEATHYRTEAFPAARCRDGLAEQRLANTACPNS